MKCTQRCPNWKFNLRLESKTPVCRKFGLPISGSRKNCFGDIVFHVDGKAFKSLGEAIVFSPHGREKPMAAFEPETVAQSQPKAKPQAPAFPGSLRGWGPITKEIE